MMLNGTLVMLDITQDGLSSQVLHMLWDHQTNPMTGEIYDANIRISADFVRAYYREYDEFVSPLIFDDPIS